LPYQECSGNSEASFSQDREISTKRWEQDEIHPQYLQSMLADPKPTQATTRDKLNDSIVEAKGRNARFEGTTSAKCGSSRMLEFRQFKAFLQQCEMTTKVRPVIWTTTV
jgi:hypothetical protein